MGVGRLAPVPIQPQHSVLIDVSFLTRGDLHFFLTTLGGSQFWRRWVHPFEGPSPATSTRHPAHFHSMYPSRTTLSHPYVACCACCCWLARNHVSCQHSINRCAVTYTDLRHRWDGSLDSRALNDENGLRKCIWHSGQEGKDNTRTNILKWTIHLTMEGLNEHTINH